MGQPHPKGTQQQRHRQVFPGHAGLSREPWVRLGQSSAGALDTAESHGDTSMAPVTCGAALSPGAFLVVCS